MLGADDKSGVTVLVSLLERIVRNKKISHGDIYFVFSQNEHERTYTIYDGIKYEELVGEGGGHIVPNSYIYISFPSSRVIYDDAYFEDGNMTLTVRKSLQGEVIATYEFYYIAP